jgi:hypothetical protein
VRASFCPVSSVDHCPRPPAMVVCASTAARYGGRPRPPRDTGACGLISNPQFRWRSSLELPEGPQHPVAECDERMAMVTRWREAQMKQLLTPAPDTMAIAWKQAALGRGDYKHTDVKPERTERAIADDLAWLAAHPVRHNNSEAAARRREFREAMRGRIREVAASRGLSDDDIKRALTLRHRHVAEFTEKHGVKLDWLLEGRGARISCARSGWRRGIAQRTRSPGRPFHTRAARQNMWMRPRRRAGAPVFEARRWRAKALRVMPAGNLRGCCCS